MTPFEKVRQDLEIQLALHCPGFRIQNMNLEKRAVTLSLFEATTIDVFNFEFNKAFRAAADFLQKQLDVEKEKVKEWASEEFAREHFRFDISRAVLTINSLSSTILVLENSSMEWEPPKYSEPEPSEYCISLQEKYRGLTFSDNHKYGTIVCRELQMEFYDFVLEMKVKRINLLKNIERHEKDLQEYRRLNIDIEFTERCISADRAILKLLEKTLAKAT